MKFSIYLVKYNSINKQHKLLIGIYQHHIHIFKIDQQFIKFIKRILPKVAKVIVIF
jgi:hypothetical protein